MKHVSIVLLVAMVRISSCAINQEKEIAKESKPSSFQPKPLGDDRSKWLVGEWNVVSGESDCLVDESGSALKIDVDEEGTSDIKVEFGLNRQFLIMKSWTETGEMTDEQKKQIKAALKETTNASDEDLERFLSMPSKWLTIQRIDPKTGERIGYFFDSLRCIAKGTGRLEGNKEIMEWEWSGTGDRKKHRKAFQNTNHSTTNCDIVKLGKNSVDPTKKWL